MPGAATLGKSEAADHRTVCFVEKQTCPSGEPDPCSINGFKILKTYEQTLQRNSLVSVK